MSRVPPASPRLAPEGELRCNTNWPIQSAKPQRLSTLPPRGLRRPDAAAYVGVSATKFDEWVARGVMPSPKRLDGVVIWDRQNLDAAFERLPDSNVVPEADIWDQVRA